MLKAHLPQGFIHIRKSIFMPAEAMSQGSGVAAIAWQLSSGGLLAIPIQAPEFPSLRKLTHSLMTTSSRDTTNLTLGCPFMH